MKSRSPAPRNLLTSLVLVFPLFLLYQLGVLYTYPMLNGADFLTAFLFKGVGLSPTQYLMFTGGVAVAFLLAITLLRRNQTFNGRVFLPVLLESALYAVTMGSVIILVMTRVFHVSPRLALPGPAFADLLWPADAARGALAEENLPSRVVMSLGAGVWEETVFRLGLLSALAAVFEKVVRFPRVVALLMAVALSSLAFSAMHYVGAYGDPLHLGSFVFRALAGVCFALLFWFRGFAVAVYTHALYDVYVLLLR